MTKKILVVDDDASIRNLLVRFLQKEHFSAVPAENGLEALQLIKETQPDVVISDAEMPGLDGHGLCRVLRQETSVHSIPLILMSGRRIQESNILAGFEGGADDYILKPFSLPVLLARVQAVLRRYDIAAKSKPILKKAGIELDPEGRTVKVNGERITLTRKEFDLLAQLVNKTGRVLSVSYLLETVWGYDPSDYNDPGTVETHISHLRKKLGPKVGAQIVNLTGHGYKFDDNAD
jgi:DNA-binding response OmpR family regulator